MQFAWKIVIYIPDLVLYQIRSPIPRLRMSRKNGGPTSRIPSGRSSNGGFALVHQILLIFSLTFDSFADQLQFFVEQDGVFFIQISSRHLPSGVELLVLSATQFIDVWSLRHRKGPGIALYAFRVRRGVASSVYGDIKVMTRRWKGEAIV
jgi:hypothetical protein